MKFLNNIDGADKLVTDASNRLVSDTKIAEWNAKPSTNTTYNEITTSEIDVGTASTLRTITARRIKYIMDKIISLITKDDVGLGNVDNTSDATKQVLSATKLSTPVNINEVPFDGSTNIIIEDNTKEPSFIKNGGFNRSFGTTAGTVVEGNDSRLSNARVPTAHSHVIGDLPAYPTLATLGGATSGHVHGNITSAGAIGTTANLMVQTTTSGVLTAKTAGTAAQFLNGVGAWATPPNQTYGAVTTSVDGLMLATDKVKLNGIATGATANTGTVTSITAGNGLNFTTISSTGAVTLGTPSTVTNATTNSVTPTSHTHALTVTKADVDLGDVTNDKQMPIAGSTFTGIAKAQNNTSYTVPQLRNISSGTANPSGGSNGDIYFKRKV